MHFVHTRADDAILVLAVFIERGRRNSAIERMSRGLPDQPNASREVPNVRLRALRPERRESYRYTGSLTTPPSSSRAVRRAGRFDRRPETPDPGLPRAHRGGQQPLNGSKVRSDVVQ
jgi:hypothetical protein